MKKKNSTTTTTADTSVKMKNARLSLSTQEYTFVLNLAENLVLRGNNPVDATNAALQVIRTVVQATNQA